MGRKRKGQFSVDGSVTNNFSERRRLLKLLFGTIFCFGAVREGRASESDYSVCWIDLEEAKVKFLDGKTVAKGQPGSLMKLVAAACLLEQHLAGAQAVIDCRGTILVNKKSYSCLHPHGRISLGEAIGQSCNVFFAKAASQIDPANFEHYLQIFGLDGLRKECGSREHISLSSVDYVLGLAKNFEITSLQIIQLVGLIACRGKMPPICVENRAENLAGAKSSARIIQFEEHTWDVLQEGMKLAGRNGTAKQLDPQNKLHLAVKTGTTIHGQRFQSWLAGYLPYEAPRFLFCLRANAGTSYDRAIPLARDFLFGRSWS